MSDTVDKDLFVLHMETLQKTMDRFDKNFQDVYSEIGSLKQELAQNTVVLKQHHQRSTQFENVHEEQIKAMQEFGETMAAMKCQLDTLKTSNKDLKNAVEPLQKKVDKMDKSQTFLAGIPANIKYWIFGVVAVATLIGIFTGQVTISDLVRMFAIGAPK